MQGPKDEDEKFRFHCNRNDSLRMILIMRGQ